MRTVCIVAVLILLAGCAGREYKDNSVEIASDPRCLNKPSNPAAEPAPWCKQKTETTFSTSSSSKTDKIDFSGKGKPG